MTSQRQSTPRRDGSSPQTFLDFSRTPFASTDQHTQSILPSGPPVLPPIPRVASRHESSSSRPYALRTQSDAPGTFMKSRNNDSEDQSSPATSHQSASSTPMSPQSARHEAASPALWKQERSFSYNGPPAQSQPERKQSPKDARSVSVAVPYASASSSTRPTRGDRPLQAATTINGVPQHSRTSSPVIESSQPKGAKRGLNLLNPVNLLLRRRSSQLPTTVNNEANTGKGMTVPPMGLPEGYDPRIRGSVIHDFSAPRPKRQVSYPATIEEDSQRSGSASEATSDHTRHLAVEQKATNRPRTSENIIERRTSDFVEHFDEPVDEDKRRSAIHAETLANHDFLSRVSWQSQQSQEPAALPVFARKSQNIDSQQLAYSGEDWQTRFSGPSSISSRSDTSALGHEANSDDRSSQSLVTSDSGTFDRSSRPISNDAYTGLNLASAVTEEASDKPPPDQKLETSPPRTSSENGLPRRFKSNASRFSFQMSGQDSIAEERILEERAKSKGVVARPLKQETPEDEADEEDDFFDEDAMYDYDEFEGGERSFNHEGETISQLSQLHENGQTALGLGIIHDPDLVNGLDDLSSIPRVIKAQESFQIGDDRPRASSDYGDSDDRSQWHSTGPDASGLAPVSTTMDITRHSRASHDFDDDLYFHDGAIDLAAYERPSSVNEDDFDDPNFLKRDKRPYGDTTLPPYGDRPDDDDHLSDSANEVSSDDEPQQYQIEGATFAIQNPSQKYMMKDSPMTRDQPSMYSEDLERPGDKSPLPSRQGSTPSKTGLAAYHSALADSVQRAAAGGKFSRQTSSATTESVYSVQSGQCHTEDTTVSGDISRANAPPHHQARGSYSAFDFGFDNPTKEGTRTQTPLSPAFPVNAFSTDESRLFDDDDDLDAYDDIISEANADALANDDSGFYSQEFGFYAKARPGSSDSDSINGGYFGERGFEMVQRSWSTKEPNLTPITERSEFSTRNSFIGGPFSPGVAPLSSPAFAAQLARMSPIALSQLQQEEERNLEQILRMRNQAFGGGEGMPRSESLSSLSSAAGYTHGLVASQRGSWQPPAIANPFLPKGGVPMVFQYSTDSSHSSTRMSRSHSEMMQEALQNGGGGHDYTDSHASNHSRPSSLSVVTTDLDATPRKGHVDSPSLQQTAHEEEAGSAAGQRPAPRQPRTHSRTGSGADSVTYKREQDEAGNDRWVMERRRTSEYGLVELIGREVVQGGRI